MRSDGFTLLELLVVIGILGILFALTSRISRDPYAMNAATTKLSAQFSRARMEALRRNEYVGVRIDPTAKKFFVFIDTNRNLTYDSTETAIPGTVAKLPSDDYPNIGFDSSVPLTGYTFVYDTRGISRSTTSFTVKLNNTARTRSKTVAVSTQGRTSIQ